MKNGGQTINGFSATSFAALVMSLGAAMDLTFARFVRFGQNPTGALEGGDQARLTARNQLDFLLSRQAAISLKYDYFDDKYEKNIFTSIGAVFVL